MKNILGKQVTLSNGNSVEHEVGVVNDKILGIHRLSELRKVGYDFPERVTNQNNAVFYDDNFLYVTMRVQFDIALEAGETVTIMPQTTNGNNVRLQFAYAHTVIDSIANSTNKLVFNFERNGSIILTTTTGWVRQTTATANLVLPLNQGVRHFSDLP